MEGEREEEEEETVSLLELFWLLSERTSDWAVLSSDYGHNDPETTFRHHIQEGPE